MAFLRIPHDVAYFTGALRTNLDLHTLARKLTRAGMPASVAKGRLSITCGEDDWHFESWEPTGLGQTGWLAFSVSGDVGALSRHLAAADIRHKLDHSRPAGLDLLTTRCITRYEHRWSDEPGLGARGAAPRIDTFDEEIQG